MANSAQARILYHDTFDGKGFTNENTLASAFLTKPHVLHPIVTHLVGRDSDKFPLTFLSQGQAGGVKTLEIEDIEYEWPTIRKMKRSDRIALTSYTSGTPGIAFTPIYVTFESNWLKYQHLVVSPNGYQCRISDHPRPLGNGTYLYELTYVTTDYTAYIPLSELKAGVSWSMEGGAPVSESYSMGNSSNKMFPGKMKNQISILRKSYEFGGNVSNRTVEVQLPTDNGSTSYWMPYERWQHTMDWKQAIEEHIWYSPYNRDEEGVIHLIDKDSGLPIPIGAGVVDQIPNEDTYGELTATRIKNTVGDIFYGLTDAVKMDVVLYTGYGGLEEFDNAMKQESKLFNQITGDKFVTGAGRNLRLGGFFTQYEHVDGHVITVKRMNLCDFGARAENARKHPRTGKPLTSYDMYFLDQTTYDGIRNVQYLTQKGRSMLTGLVKGMSPVPMDFKGNSTEYMATEQDKCSVHFLSTCGVVLNRNTTSFKLTCNLS